MKEHIKLQEKLTTLISEVDGKVGIFSYLVDKGPIVSINGEEIFPLLSNYKIPIAIKFLKEFEKELWDLDKLFEIQAKDILKSSAILDHRHFYYPGISLSLKNILRLMLEYSDNTASDIILKLAGGPDQVTNFLKRLGYQYIQINRSIAQIFLEQSQQNSKDALNSHKDSGTPKEMVKLLVEVIQNNILNSSAKQLLLDCMSRCKTGDGRIRAFLPPNTMVANKTGTAAGFVNDLGIIDLPLGNKLILAVYHKNTRAHLKTSEQLIANIAKNIFEYVVCGEG